VAANMPELVYYLLIFFAIGVFFLFIHLMIGKLIRPARPEADKLTIYECGEPTVGSAWIQFDLRYYVVALLFVIFDVEVAFFFPWAVVFGSANALSRENLDPTSRKTITQNLTPSSLLLTPAQGKMPVGGLDAATAHQWALIAFADIVVFFGVLMVGFAYLWKRGDINWVRSTAAERALEPPPEILPVYEEADVPVRPAEKVAST
jgi:NADH-quinone oxidoreductase subunit A